MPGHGRKKGLAYALLSSSSNSPLCHIMRGTIDLEEMIVGIAKLRGEARRSDIVGVGLVARSIQADIRRLEDQLRVALAAVNPKVGPQSATGSCVVSPRQQSPS